MGFELVMALRRDHRAVLVFHEEAADLVDVSYGLALGLHEETPLAANRLK